MYYNERNKNFHKVKECFHCKGTGICSIFEEENDMEILVTTDCIICSGEGFIIEILEASK